MKRDVDVTFWVLLVAMLVAGVLLQVYGDSEPRREQSQSELRYEYYLEDPRETDWR